MYLLRETVCSNVAVMSFIPFNMQRDIYFSDKLGLLVSAGYDGSVKLWRNTTIA